MLRLVGAVAACGGTDAQITGTLVLRNGCVGLAIGDRVLAVIWPSGTELDDADPLVLQLPSGGLVAEGQSVQGAGGFSTPDAIDRALEIPAACDLDADEIAVSTPTTIQWLSTDGRPSRLRVLKLFEFKPKLV